MALIRIEISYISESQIKRIETSLEVVSVTQKLRNIGNDIYVIFMKDKKMRVFCRFHSSEIIINTQTNNKSPQSRNENFCRNKRIYEYFRFHFLKKEKFISNCIIINVRSCKRKKKVFYSYIVKCKSASKTCEKGTGCNDGPKILNDVHHACKRFSDFTYEV